MLFFYLFLCREFLILFLSCFDINSGFMVKIIELYSFQFSYIAPGMKIWWGVKSQSVNKSEISCSLLCLSAQQCLRILHITHVYSVYICI